MSKDEIAKFRYLDIAIHVFRSDFRKKRKMTFKHF